jgi:hypothetical protein
VITAYGWNWLRSIQLLQNSIPHPTGKPWDYVFKQRRPYWVIVTFKNGSKVAGRYGERSFASSSPQKEQIYLEETWVLNEDGGFDRPTCQTAGVIITADDITSVELLEYYPKEGGRK